MFKKFIKKLSQLVLASLVMIAPALSSVAPSKVYAKASSDTTSYDSIAEIFNSTTGHFKTTELTQLIQKVTHSSKTGDDLFDDLVEVAESTKTSAQIRSNNNSKDVNVTFGGLEWTVTYLSLDDNNRPILTLWLANRLNTQFTDWNGNDMQCATDYDWEVYDAVAGVSAYASGWWSTNRTATNPGNMYGTSYVRSLIMGTPYVQGYTDSEKTIQGDMSNEALYFDYVTDSNSIHQASVFANFISNFGSFLVSPSKVSWQRSGQHASTQFGWTHDLPNETYEASTNVSANGNNITATGESGETYLYYSGTSDDYTQNGNNMNYSQREHYADWKNDKLWLPSLTEVGYNDDDGIGIWATSQNQRMLGMGDDENYNYAYDYSWLRSGGSSVEGAYDLDSTGGAYDGDFTVATDGALAVRPALHLDLNSASIDAGIKTKVFPNTGISISTTGAIVAILAVLVVGIGCLLILTQNKKVIIKK